MKATVCTYRAVGDGDAAFRLWERTIGRTWPLDRSDFEAIVREGLVAVHDGHVVGIVAIARAERLASVQLLLVAPELRRRGIGRALVTTVLDGLSDYGAEELRLGGTPGPYFWPGVPPELVGSRPFLEHQGWRFSDPCWDLVRSLSDYESPVEVARRATGVTYRLAAEDDRRRLRRFEASRFPEWAPAFAADETLERSIIALDEGGSVVGSLLASDRRRRRHCCIGCRGA